jgi:hypothetical protein
MNQSLHTALFYFGWAAVVVAAFFVQHYVRVAAGYVANFWSNSAKPALATFDAFLGRHEGVLLIGGLITTVFGTLLCAASSHWIGITDVRAFACGLAVLVLGMVSTIRATN